MYNIPYNIPSYGVYRTEMENIRTVRRGRGVLHVSTRAESTRSSPHTIRSLCFSTQAVCVQDGSPDQSAHTPEHTLSRRVDRNKSIMSVSTCTGSQYRNACHDARYRHLMIAPFQVLESQTSEGDGLRTDRREREGGERTRRRQPR